MAGMMHNEMSPPPLLLTPPAVPVSAYYVAPNDSATGPFDIATLKQMANTGQIASDSMLWKEGMAQWAKAETIEELKGIFGLMPPIPQPEQK